MIIAKMPKEQLTTLDSGKVVCIQSQKRQETQLLYSAENNIYSDAPLDNIESSDGLYYILGLTYGYNKKGSNSHYRYLAKLAQRKVVVYMSIAIDGGEITDEIATIIYTISTRQERVGNGYYEQLFFYTDDHFSLGDRVRIDRVVYSIDVIDSQYNKIFYRATTGE